MSFLLLLYAQQQRLGPAPSPDRPDPAELKHEARKQKIEHPNTRRYQSHCARLLLMTDRPAEALQLARPALAHERVNGPNRPWTKDSAVVTADALAALRLAAEAETLRKQYGIEDQAL